MNDEITPELFNQLVKLVALELDPEEADYLRRELNHQLKTLRELESISLDPETPLASRGLTYTLDSSPAIREDVIQPYPNPSGLLQTAPETADGYIVVPEIPHQNLK